MTQILVVEDDSRIRANLIFHLRDEGFAPTAVESGEGALAFLDANEARLPDLLLLDVRLPSMSGIDLVRSLVDQKRLPPTIMISGEATISETVEALRLGVHDFIEKPFSRARLLHSVRKALEHNSLQREVYRLENRLAERNEILGRSKPMLELRELIAQAAPTDARILLQGESGTGKELVADAIHRQSSRAHQPFIKINCAAIAPQLIEDELFGHVKGAFTDARQDRAGLFEEAHRGTLFLDEIGDMELGLQSRLLRVLEDGKVRRVGETREREVNVRIIAATHANLEALVREGRFREDLFFRLASVPITIPPLRERGSDVGRLFEHFVNHYTQRHRMRKRTIDAGVFESLAGQHWPGNVRELKNLCERLVVLGGDPITVQHLPKSDRSSGEESKVASMLSAVDPIPILPWREFKAQSEREYLERVLETTKGNVSAAARALGIQRTHLHQKLASLGVRRGTSE